MSELREILAKLRAEERRHLAAARRAREAIALLETETPTATKPKPAPPKPSKPSGKRGPRRSRISDHVEHVLSDGKPHPFADFDVPGLHLDSIKTRLWRLVKDGAIRRDGKKGEVLTFTKVVVNGASDETVQAGAL